MVMSHLKSILIPTGWFVEIEIARNLWERYNKGEAIAKVFNLDTSSEATMWKDRAFCELCRSVNYSFQKSKMTIVDKYTCSNQFMSHCQRENERGRTVPAVWSWIGGLMGTTCPVWHQYGRSEESSNPP